MLCRAQTHKERDIAVGGMGTIYKGTNIQTGETDAIKLPEADDAAHDGVMRERFAFTGEALRQLNHPYIVKMQAADEVNNRHHLIKEYVGIEYPLAAITRIRSVPG